MRVIMSEEEKIKHDVRVVKLTKGRNKGRYDVQQYDVYGKWFCSTFFNSKEEAESYRDKLLNPQKAKKPNYQRAIISDIFKEKKLTGKTGKV